MEHMAISKNRGVIYPPKWMVKIMVPNPINMDDLGVPLFLETPICWTLIFCEIVKLFPCGYKTNKLLFFANHFVDTFFFFVEALAVPLPLLQRSEQRCLGVSNEMRELSRVVHSR